MNNHWYDSGNDPVASALEAMETALPEITEHHTEVASDIERAMAHLSGLQKRLVSLGTDAEDKKEELYELADLAYQIRGLLTDTPVTEIHNLLKVLDQ